MNLIRLEELSLMSNAVLTPQLNNWPCIQSPNLEDTDCQKHRDSFSEHLIKNFIKNGENNKRKYLKIFRVMPFYSALKRLCS
jgi:hypothetical protein